MSIDENEIANFAFPEFSALPEALPAEEMEEIAAEEVTRDLEEEAVAKFYENLAEKMPSKVLDAISTYLFDAIDEDAKGRDDLIDAADKVLKFAGIESLEDLMGDGVNAKVVPNTLRTFDSTFQTCLTRNHADIFPQLYPQLGPAGYYVNGSKDGWGELDEVGATGRDFINWYLTVEDSDYYSDASKGVLTTIFYGTGFKKIYHNPDNVAISRFISPRKFIINPECNSILESNRLTHELDLSKREILQMMQNGLYKEVNLPYLENLTSDDAEPITTETPAAKDDGSKTYRGQFPFYECHTYLNLKDFTSEEVDEYSQDTIPLPYVVTMDKTSKKVLSLRRNWSPDDEEQKRIEIFDVMNYMRGFGIYGRGLIHLIGSNAITLTKILRALVDAAIYQNLPSGVCAKGIKEPDKEFILGPGQFKGIDVVGSIRDAFMPLPFNGPSPALLELYKTIVEQTKELGSIADMGVTDTKDNVSPLTAFGVMDHVSKIQSAALQSFHTALSRELQMIWKVLKETTDYQEFTHGQKARTIRKEDFIEEIAIIPVSTPEMNSRAQKVMKIQSLQTVSGQFPGLFKSEAIARKMLDAMGMTSQEIDDVMYSPEELQQQQESAPPQLDPNALTLADIQQRAAEVEARMKIAEGQQAVAVFEKETDLQIAAAKLKIDMETAKRKEEEARIKSDMEHELQVMKEQMLENNRRAEHELAQFKMALDRYKAELGLEETELKIEADKELAEFNASVKLVEKEISNGSVPTSGMAV